MPTSQRNCTYRIKFNFKNIFFSIMFYFIKKQCYNVIMLNM